MKVFPIIPRGYCKGVVEAIKIAKENSNNNENIYILGMIVHNQFIVDALESLGIKTIDKKNANRLELLDEIEQGTVIITAHGASDAVFNKAKEKGLNVIDATCKDVIKTHELVKKYISNGYEVLYIGKQGHPESEGVLAINKDKIHLIEQKKDLLSIDKEQKYIITNQTTMSLYDVYHICNEAKEIFNQIIIQDEVCNATTIRQQAIANIDKNVDIIFIVGDPASHNSHKLATIAKQKHNIETHLIEHIGQIELDWLKNKKYAAVSSGASTPTYLTNQVIKFLEEFDINNKITHKIPNIDINRIL